MIKFTKIIYIAILFFYCFLTGGTLYGQNPNTQITTPPDSLLKPPFVLIDSISYRFMGDGNFSRGNIIRDLIILRTELIFAGPAVAITTNPRFTYGKQNNILAERDTYVDLFIDILKQRQVYIFGLATVENSNLRKIDLRQLAGAGIGIHFLRTGSHTLNLTSAVIHESTNFRERATIVTQRNSTRLKGKHSFLQDKIRLTHITFVQPALNDFSNLRWNTLISVELPLTRWVSVRTSFENSFESIVEASRKQNDTRLTFGLSVGNRR